MLGLLLILISFEVFAFRNAVFPKRFDGRAILHSDIGKDFFVEQTAKDSERPIWIHGGDSLSTGWAHATTLGEKLELFKSGLEIEAGSLDDFKLHAPRTDFSTWYAGSETTPGLLDTLDASKGTPWLVLSTAQTGIFLSDLRPDPLDLMSPKSLHITDPTRVKLVTFSLGANDTCSLVNPTEKPKRNQKSLAQRLLQLKKSYPPTTRIVAFAPPPISKMRAFMQKVVQVPSDNTRPVELWRQYCEEIWTKVFCFAGSEENLNKMDQIQSQILKSYQDAGLEVFDPFESLLKKELTPEAGLDLIAGDCFHPSHKAQGLIQQEMEKFIGINSQKVLNPASK